MIDQIRKTTELVPYLTQVIEDAGIKVEVDPKIIDIDDFLSVRFKEIFLSDRYKYRNISLQNCSALEEKFCVYNMRYHLIR